MTSNLTRRVFRSILANEPIVHRGCLRRRHYGSIRQLQESTARCEARNGRPFAVQQQRRTFFLNMFGGGKKRESKEADMDPGIETMMEYVKKDKMRARLPPPRDVAKALDRFVFHVKGEELQIKDTQAKLMIASLRYCLDHDKTTKSRESSSKSIIKPRTLGAAVRVLHETQSPTASHADLAKLLYETTPNRRAKNTYVRMLALIGHAHEARRFVLDLEARGGPLKTSDHDVEDLDLNHLDDTSAAVEDNSPSSGTAVEFAQLWVDVLRGFAQLDSESDLLETWDMMRARGIESIRAFQYMLEFYLRGDNIHQVKSWFFQFWRQPQEMPLISRHSAVLKEVLPWCLRHQQIEFGHEVVRRVLATNPPKPIWDAVFVWAAGTGKGADEIDRLFSVMESANKSIADRSKWNTPDIATINALVELATSKNDPYLAERFIAIGKARDINADANTYVLQMKYRLKISDIDGALIAYKNLQSMDLSSNEDVPTVNELIVALCNSKRHDFDTIMNVAADLSDRKAWFEPATATALALLHLGRGEMYDVTDLMNTHAYHYSTSERESIRRDLVAYCLNPETPLTRVWDAYNVLVEIFDEMPRDERTQIMLVFFKRERPDVSVNIFNTMRSHYREDTIPTVDTYVAAFLGAAKLRDLDTVEVIHNQLKLDTNIDTSTYLLNALIIGYSACGSARRALTFWDDIVASKEGPTYNSIHIALRACEKSPFGDVRAERIWAKLRSMSIDLDQALWTSYIAALAGNGNTEKSISTLEEAESKGELEVDAFIIGSLFAGCPGQAPQADVESWCKEKYPQIWEELEKIGMDEDENGMRSFKIDRTVTP